MKLTATAPPLIMMADFRPFQALRYNPSRADIEKVIAPPYDVISPEEQLLLYQRSPYNCIRLILNRIEDSDNGERNRYLRARNFFHEWKAQGILVQDPRPGYYLYRQIFSDPISGASRERLALLGRLRLESFEKGIVIPHEKTLSKPREDRRKLLETTQANFSPVFGLYEDSSAIMASLYEEAVSAAPLFEAKDDQSVRHALWAIQGASEIQQIQRALSQERIYIADGHHRYQTALEYSQDVRRQRGASSKSEIPTDSVLMALVEFRDPGLVLMPTHRLLPAIEGLDLARLTDLLRPYFKVEPIDPERMNFASGSFGLLLASGAAYCATLEDRSRVKPLMRAGKPDFWYDLDVNLLNDLVFEHVLGLNEARRETLLRYTHSLQEAVRQVEKGSAQAAFLLNPPRVEILREMGEARELLPQKSTFFYPKLASGLVFYSHTL